MPVPADTALASRSTSRSTSHSTGENPEVAVPRQRRAPGTDAAVTSSTPELTVRRTRSGRRSRAKVETPPPPLGSLTQRDHRIDANCRGCGSPHIIRLSMRLTDGTPVDFTSCHRCEHRTWERDGVELTVAGVLERTRKIV